MRTAFQAFSSYRPRLLTLLLLATGAAVLALANASDDFSPRVVPPRAPTIIRLPDLNFDVSKSDAWQSNRGLWWNLSYGWPLLWRQYVVEFTPGPPLVVGRCWSAGRVAANAALWIAMLAVPGAACEWLLRRHRPRFRWSLRTMLGAVVALALVLAWFVAARDRADSQDALINTIENGDGTIQVERWGPKWLDFVGADGYRRRIVGVEAYGWNTFDQTAEEQERTTKDLIARLARLPDLRYLTIDGAEFTPGIAKALGELRHLRTLSIEDSSTDIETMDILAASLRGMTQLRVLSLSGFRVRFSEDEERTARACLASVGQMTQIEHLRLEGMSVSVNSLGALAGLENLKSLTLDTIVRRPDDEDADRPLLSGLPVMPSLETLSLEFSNVGDGDLSHLARQPRLKSLALIASDCTGAGLTALSSLGHLEELALEGDAATASGFESLLALRHLKKLHFDTRQNSMSGTWDEILPDFPPVERDRCFRALSQLRQSNPGILIDGDWLSCGWHETLLVPSEYDTPARSSISGFRAVVDYWKAHLPDAN